MKILIKRRIKNSIFFIVMILMIVIGTYFILNSTLNRETEVSKKSVDTPKNTTKSLNSLMRVKCIEKIKDEIRLVFKKLIPKDRPAHLFDIPDHRNYGDTLIWVGEEQLFVDLGINVTHRLLCHDKKHYSKSYLVSKISPKDTILFHGGGNFGDLYRFNINLRRFTINLFPTSKIVVLPQTIYYKNKTLAIEDNKVFKNTTDLTICVRSFDSYNFSKSMFPGVHTVAVPDAAFMIGDVTPLREPSVDVLILRRNDSERKQGDLKKWEVVAKQKLGTKFTYKIRDWFDYKDVNYKTLDELRTKRLGLVNTILSEGRVIITDRLHVSVMSVLMGKPHVIINEKYGKIWKTRELAFSGKSECAEKHLNGHFANDIEQAFDTAKRLLTNTS